MRAMTDPPSPPRAMRGALGGTSEQAPKAWRWPRGANAPAKAATGVAGQDDAATESEATEADEDAVDDLLQRVADLVKIASRPAKAKISPSFAEANASVEEGAGTGSTFTGCTLEVVRLQRENAALLLQVRAVETECALLKQKALELEATHEAALTSWNQDMLHLNLVQSRELKQLRENDCLQKALDARGAEVTELRRALAASESREMHRVLSASAGNSRPQLLSPADNNLSTSHPAIIHCERCGHRVQVECAVVHVPSSDAEISARRSNEPQVYSRLDDECRAVLQRLFPVGTPRPTDVDERRLAPQEPLELRHRTPSPQRTGNLRLLDGTLLADQSLVEDTPSHGGHQATALLMPRYSPTPPNRELRYPNEGCPIADPGVLVAQSPPHRFASPSRPVHVPMPAPEALVRASSLARPATPPASPLMGVLCRTQAVWAMNPPSSPGSAGFRHTLGVYRSLTAPPGSAVAPPSLRKSLPSQRHLRPAGFVPSGVDDCNQPRSVSPSYRGGSCPHN